jgi:hypothetical protein
VIADAHRRRLVDLRALSKRVARYAAGYGVRDRGADLGMKLIARLLDQVGYQDRGVEHGRQVSAIADRLVTLDPDVLSNISKLLDSTGAVEDLSRVISDQNRHPATVHDIDETEAP